MFPTVGRTVHYRTLKDGDHAAPLAAIIVKTDGVYDEHGHKHECNEACAKVSLLAFCAEGPCTTIGIPNAPYSEKPKAGAWCWPPKV